MDGDGGFAATMRDALRLVRSGALREATRTIQGALSRRAAADTGAGASVDAQIVREALAAPEPAPSAAEPARTTEQPRAATYARRAPTLFRTPTMPPAVARCVRTNAPLRARLAPPAGADGPRPLLVMLHGCKQDADDFARGTRMDRAAEERGWFVLYPEQSQRANGSRCWNWFDPVLRTPGAGEDGALIALIEATIAAHAVDSSRVYVAGLSAGGAMAVVLAANHPERFAAVGVHSGLPYGAAANIPEAFAAMRDGGAAPALPPGRCVPLVSIHGDADATVTPRNADRLVAQWLAAGDAHAWRCEESAAAGGRARLHRWRDAEARVALEDWRCAALGHAWSGGDPAGSYTDASGPDASTILLDFFERHALART